MKPWKIISIIMILISLTGCGRNDKKNIIEPAQAENTKLTGADTAPASEAASVSEKENSRIELKPAQNSTAAQKAQTQPMSAEAIHKRHNLLSEINTAVITPEDFEIGLLLAGHADAEGSLEKKYTDFINRFFKELEKGNLASEMIYPDSRFFLKQVFESYIAGKQIPDNLRIGEAIRIQDSLRFNLRLYKGNSRTEGEIIIVESENGLKIKEFYGDLAILEKTYTAAEKKYEPELYRF